MYPVFIGNGRCLQSDAVVYGCQYHVPKGVSIEHALGEGFFLLDYKILKIKMAIELKMVAKLKSQIAA
jgi:hypothetical protein